MYMVNFMNTLQSKWRRYGWYVLVGLPLLSFKLPFYQTFGYYGYHGNHIQSSFYGENEQQLSPSPILQYWSQNVKFGMCRSYSPFLKTNILPTILLIWIPWQFGCQANHVQPCIWLMLWTNWKQKWRTRRPALPHSHFYNIDHR